MENPNTKQNNQQDGNLGQAHNPEPQNPTKNQKSNPFKTFGYAFVQSISSPGYSNDIVKASPGFSFKYYAVLALLLTVVSAAVQLPKTIAAVNEFTSQASQALPRLYPEELEITVQNGELSINQPEPFIYSTAQLLTNLGVADELFNKSNPINSQSDIQKELESWSQNNPSTQQIPQNFVVIDSEGTINDMNELDTLVLINKSNILINNNGQLNVTPVADFPDGTFDYNTYTMIVESVQPLFQQPTTIILAITALNILGLVIYYFTWRLFITLFVAIGLMIVGNIRKVKLDLTKYYQIALHALTIPLIFEALVRATGVFIPVLMWLFVTNLIIGIVGVWKLDLGESASIEESSSSK